MNSAEELGCLLTDKKMTISTAESCTGGLIGAAITSVSGSSVYYKGGVISYANELKHNLLGVPDEVLAAFGAVSAETVRYMAKGVTELCITDSGVSVSGIAGPGGGTDLKPVGLVFIGVCIRGELYHFEHHFKGDRESIRRDAAEEALAHIIHLIA